jgi:hypothetical protein
VKKAKLSDKTRETLRVAQERLRGIDRLYGLHAARDSVEKALAAHEHEIAAETLEEAAGHAERVIAPSLIGHAFGATLRALATERRKP